MSDGGTPQRVRHFSCGGSPCAIAIHDGLSLTAAEMRRYSRAMRIWIRLLRTFATTWVGALMTLIALAMAARFYPDFPTIEPPYDAFVLHNDFAVIAAALLLPLAIVALRYADKLDREEYVRENPKRPRQPRDGVTLFRQ
jgi:hypothetical protein